MRASQLHKLNVRGETSDFTFKALLKYIVQHGTDTVPTTVQVNGFGNIGDTLTATVDIGGGDLVSNYVVVAAEEVDTVMAIGLAAAIQAQTDVTCVAIDNMVKATKTTAGTITVISTAVT